MKITEECPVSRTGSTALAGANRPLGRRADRQAGDGSAEMISGPICVRMAFNSPAPDWRR